MFSPPFSLTNATNPSSFTNTCPFHLIVSHHSLSQMQVCRTHSRTYVLFTNTCPFHIVLSQHSLSQLQLFRTHSRTHPLCCLITDITNSPNMSNRKAGIPMFSMNTEWAPARVCVCVCVYMLCVCVCVCACMYTHSFSHTHAHKHA